VSFVVRLEIGGIRSRQGSRAPPDVVSEIQPLGPGEQMGGGVKIRKAQR